MLSELKGFFYKLSKKYSVTEKSIATIFYKLKKDIKNRINCNTENCNKLFLRNFIKSNVLYNIFLSSSNSELDLMLDSICDKICPSYNLQFDLDRSNSFCLDNTQTITIAIENQGEEELPANTSLVLSLTNLPEEYILSSGFCTFEGNILTTKIALAVNALFLLTVTFTNTDCSSLVNVVNLLGDNVVLYPVTALSLEN